MLISSCLLDSTLLQYTNEIPSIQWHRAVATNAEGTMRWICQLLHVFVSKLGLRGTAGLCHVRSRLDRGAFWSHLHGKWWLLSYFKGIIWLLSRSHRNQVYSEAQKRWLHVDPSDNVIDAPMMYQHGWKRKIDYILAYSNEDVQDVTWRYTNNHASIRRNRTNCTENEMIKTISLLREKRQKDLSAVRKRFLKLRLLREIIQSMVEREPTADELKGRSSGSLSWRASRGEKETCSTNNVSFG